MTDCQDFSTGSNNEILKDLHFIFMRLQKLQVPENKTSVMLNVIGFLIGIVFLETAKLTCK